MHRELWEKKPLLVKRHIPNYNDGWFSTAELDRILRKVITEPLMFEVTVIRSACKFSHYIISK